MPEIKDTEKNKLEKLRAYIDDQIQVTKNTCRDPVIAAVILMMIILLFTFAVWPLLEIVKQSLVDTRGNFSFQAYINVFTMAET